LIVSLKKRREFSKEIPFAQSTSETYCACGR
jgi:hypothetical protein